MIRIRDLLLPVEHTREDLLYHAAQALRIKASQIQTLQIFKRSLDARKKPLLRWVYTVDVALHSGERLVLRQARSNKITREEPYHYSVTKKVLPHRPVVVGFGPAGMFAALTLALAGSRPIVLERGDRADVRREKVEAFWNGGTLDPESNVLFGEGGAGTFSDGKLNTGTKNPRSRWILRQLVKFGAPEEILYDAKPHVGTDILFYVVQNIRRRIESLGGEVRFGARFTDFCVENGEISAVSYVEQGETVILPCKSVILAIGHSARDTYRALHGADIPMEPKPFSMGCRIEHPQTLVDQAQYGQSRSGSLPPADYKLSCHMEDGSSAYTFCMCPGGYVVAAASQENTVVTNGMSYSGRDGENANAALLVTLKPERFPYPGALGGMLWQEEIEAAAFRLGGGNYHAPAQKVGDFLKGISSSDLGAVEPTYRPGVTLCNLHELFPGDICQTLSAAIKTLDGQLQGFASADALLTAPETRSSAPVRILRGENFQSSLRGLYPCGEGAGYAGGIMSAAADGMACAEAVLQAE